MTTWIVTFFLYTFHSFLFDVFGNKHYLWVDPYPIPYEEPVEFRQSTYSIGASEDRKLVY